MVSCSLLIILVSFQRLLDGIKLISASYGSLARFKDIQRLHPLGSHTVLAAAGDMSDFQYLQKKLNALV